MATNKKKARRKKNRRRRERASIRVDEVRDHQEPFNPPHWRTLNWKLNVYICTKKHPTTTVDVDEGTTPFMIGCKMPGCDEMAKSCFYPKERPVPIHIPVPMWEFYKPDIKKVKPIERNHVEQGGLLLRKRTHAKPVCHKQIDKPEPIGD